jgi:hypothetical protein
MKNSFNFSFLPSFFLPSENRFNFEKKTISKRKLIDYFTSEKG